ncbi:hypothetical protein TSUD_86570 [Trifolium subterraneum]|uniref:PLAT domain-containing protein n=1 Tax=Trifolium subterraneum TaxID=3900 RepID=A0A2Z6PDP5_TRISU|nr:hypothetical protein TSUD_86570 [Trifolium subterraneum]
MAGTKHVMVMNCMPQNKIDGLQGSTPLSLSHSIKKHKLVYSWSMNGSKSKTKFRVMNQKGKQIAPQDETEDITSTKFTALVSVRNSSDNNDKAFVNNILSIFMPQNHSKGCVVLQLVSTKLDPRSMEPKLSQETVLEFSKLLLEDKRSKSSTYKVEFIVDSDFGVPGAVTAVNYYDNEFFLETINIKEKEKISFSSKSWVQPNKLDPHKRVFFVNKVRLSCCMNPK